MDRNKLIFLGFITALGIAATSLIVSQYMPYALDDDDEVDDPQDIGSNAIDVVTLDATRISSLFATLNGELVDMGNYSSVKVYFVWGENSGEYTKETPKQIMTSPGEFSAEISDLLMPDNTYYFQARTDPEGRGEEVSFYVN